ncbi:MAG: hypothetical protein J5825_04860 [Lachnospiraceae bacterium]|nr:hypothetical protein [Lachnospiraceae bacterium]
MFTGLTPISIIFIISLSLMVLLLIVIAILGLILLFSTKPQKELKPVKGAIAVLFSLCGLAILCSVACFILMSRG